MMKMKIMIGAVAMAIVALMAASANAGLTTLEIPISRSMDDFEEEVGALSMDLTSTDLEMPVDGTAQQIVALIFRDVQIDPGQTIVEANVRFDVDETKGAGEVNLLIYGDAGGSSSLPLQLPSERNWTTAVESWSPENWTVTHVKHYTSDISSIIQEIVDGPLWTKGSSLGLYILDDPSNPSAGTRCAESFDGAGSNADRIPLLTVVVPEPATMFLLGLGGLILRRRRKA